MSASITTAGWSASAYAPGSMIDTKPVLSNAVCVETCGIFSVIRLPGLKPSARLKSVGSTGVPEVLLGIWSECRSSRRPVSVLASALVK